MMGKETDHAWHTTILRGEIWWCNKRIFLFCLFLRDSSLRMSYHRHPCHNGVFCFGLWRAQNARSDPLLLPPHSQLPPYPHRPTPTATPAPAPGNPAIKRSYGEVFRQSSHDVFKALVGRSPSDASDDDVETATTIMTDGRPEPPERPAAPTPTDPSKAAPIYPARGAAIPKLRASYSQRDVRTKAEHQRDQRAYSASDPGDDADADAWKESPPLLQRMETPPAIRRLGKSGSRRGSKSKSERLSITSTTSSLPKLGEESKAPSEESGGGGGSGGGPRHGRNVSEPLDFWDPLNLLGGESKVMTPVTPVTPMSSSSAARGSGGKPPAPNWSSSPRSARKLNRSFRSDNSE